MGSREAPRTWKTITGDLTYLEIRESLPEDVAFDLKASGCAGSGGGRRAGKALQAEGRACAQA